MINVVFLMVVAFSPFPTRVLASTLRDGGRAGAFAYGLTFTLMAISYGGLWLYASRNGRLLREDADPKTVSGITRSFAPGSLLYVTAMLSALISGYVAVALFAAIALFYVFESSVFGRG
jgi:TMEM175 potassium channel family protein